RSPTAQLVAPWPEPAGDRLHPSYWESSHQISYISPMVGHSVSSGYLVDRRLQLRFRVPTPPPPLHQWISSKRRQAMHPYMQLDTMPAHSEAEDAVTATITPCKAIYAAAL